ncbi:MAG: toxic anion resistance protein [Peptostreptococcus anaerobius]
MDTNKIELTLSPELKSVDIGDKLKDGKLLEEMANLGLTHDEIKMVGEFSEKIDIKNSQQILEYGVGVQKKLSDFSEKTLDTIRTKDLGEIGSMISSL